MLLTLRVPRSLSVPVGVIMSAAANPTTASTYPARSRSPLVTFTVVPLQLGASSPLDRPALEPKD